MSALPSRDHLTGVAVDFGGTKIAAARIECGQVIRRLQVETDGASGPQGQVTAMASLLNELDFRSGEVLGVAVTGRISETGYWHAVNQETLSGIELVPLADLLSDRFGRATVVNDAAAAALAEYRLGAGQGARNFLYLTVSTGVGGGIILDDRLVISGNGLAGHIGFASSRLGTGHCGSGRQATVEGVAGGRGIAAAAAEAGLGYLDARSVFLAARTGDKRAEELILRSAHAIALLIADLTAALGLDRVAIGGSIGLADGYLEHVADYLQAEPALFRPEILRAALGQDSALLGALHLAVPAA